MTFIVTFGLDFNMLEGADLISEKLAVYPIVSV
jgi:hypothetical protein